MFSPELMAAIYRMGHGDEFVKRFALNERAKNAFVVMLTGDVRKYTKLILKKGGN